MLTDFSNKATLLFWATSLLIGGTVGWVANLVFGKLAPHNRQSLLVYILLGVVGFYSGAYLSYLTQSTPPGARSLLLSFAIAGAIIFVLVGHFSGASIKRFFGKQTSANSR